MGIFIFKMILEQVVFSLNFPWTGWFRNYRFWDGLQFFLPFNSRFLDVNGQKLCEKTALPTVETPITDHLRVPCQIWRQWNFFPCRKIEIRRIAMFLVFLFLKSKLLWIFGVKSWPEHIPMYGVYHGTINLILIKIRVPYRFSMGSWSGIGGFTIVCRSGFIMLWITSVAPR